MTVTSGVQPLQTVAAAPTLAEAMEPLRLFVPETLEKVGGEAGQETSRTLRAIPTEHLEAAEQFLQTRSVDAEPLAAIQAAILVCEGAGDISEQGLDHITVDEGAFPLAAAAVDRTRKLIRSPHSSWPEGFWPCFLLRVLCGEQPGRPD